jgi:hypothetical protein
MIVHKAVGIAEPLKPIRNVVEEFNEIAAVLVTSEDPLTGVATGGDVIQGTRVFDTERTCH